jgi:outer membrane protein assembly factor BamB
MKLKPLVYVSLFALLASFSQTARAQRLTPSDPSCGGTVNNKPFVNWSQFHFDPCHTGFNPYETVLSPANVANLVLDWKYEAPDHEGFESSPAVADGLLYVGGTGFGDGNVYAVNARTGAGVWEWENNSVSVGSPAVAYGKVYGADYNRGVIHALNAENGTWVGNWGDGDQVWDVTVANGAIYAASSHFGLQRGGAVYAVNADTGDLLWRHRMSDSDTVTPAVANGMVYTECLNSDPDTVVTFCALDAGTGATIWQYAPPTLGYFFPPAVSNGVVYAGGLVTYSRENNYSNQGIVYALFAATGALLWQRPLTAALGRGHDAIVTTTPAVANGAVYIGAADFNDPSFGYLLALDSGSGALIWSYKTQAGIQSSPIVANGVVYFGSSDTNIYALDSTTGALLWKYPIGSPVTSSPVVANGMLYVGSGFYMYAFHLPH